ncbi:acyltransferase [Sphingobacterium sp. SRCM116780]|uniref:acyltransferase n=1 Tax=Sphingobacterium sp. SRCM116780 TaxID=2907623 RepID=UPI001F49278F|nr:acyltransferase [Sphingobacterium sp. SRCM116780]UIR56006.1 acyltransferase [Sphingobacterium sp. SRCM116780]
MKKIIKGTYNLLFLFINRLYAFCVAKNSTFFLAKLSTQNNKCCFKNALIHQSQITANGRGNKIFVKGELFNTKIEMHGNNNVVYLQNNTEIHDATIIIRGDGCKLYIGEKSTFGGGRMVIMGSNNVINIGKGCMMSDQIELWATDSHPIYNEDNIVINKSKPIHIEDSVWIGARSSILKGVLIRKGAIIGMGSTVVKDVPSFCICAGNPLKVIKEHVTWSREYIRI